MSRFCLKRCWRAGLLAAALVVGVWAGRFFCLKHPLPPRLDALHVLPARSLLAPPAAPTLAASADAALTNPPSPRSPVDTFRELLAMTAAERKQFLADRRPETQKQILAKVREYESLNPNQRELRLRITELYYYLWPLMNSPATNRPAQLALVPDRDRKEIQTRLLVWDRLPARKQQELLANAATLRYFTGLKTGPPPLPPFSSAQQARLERGIRQWQDLPKDQQRKITSRFERFFDLTPEERQKALNTLSEPERQQIDKTLYKFENLSPADRAQCLSNFAKFASLTLAQRWQFLRNAELWRLMPPAERQNWRDLVNDLPQQPPRPPGLEGPPAPWFSRPPPTNRN